nr:MAG TPA: hypothetical protein [Caudoviricetes sp.]DAU80092.1 MAG TPA: hypothetical protein [Caudoviricetes sp.]
MSNELGKTQQGSIKPLQEWHSPCFLLSRCVWVFVIA